MVASSSELRHPLTAEELLDLLGVDPADPELRTRMEAVRPAVEAAEAERARVAGMSSHQRAAYEMHKRLGHVPGTRDLNHPDPEVRRANRREYHREWRARQRAKQAAPPPAGVGVGPGPGTPADGADSA